MKIVLLLAGQGKRFNNLTINNHKSLIKIENSINILKYIEICFRKINFNEIIFVLGHCGKMMKKKIEIYFKKYESKIKFVYVDDYKKYNSLYSVYCAKNLLLNNNFLIINGDTIFPYTFLENLIENKKTCISLQYSKNIIDAPKVFLNKKNLIKIDRQSKLIENNNLKFKGFMTGMIYINKNFSKIYFQKSKYLINKNYDSGMYDPLVNVHHKKVDLVYQAGIWCDFDEIKDLPKVKLILNTNLKLKKLNYIL
jgi:choline kinase